MARKNFSQSFNNSLRVESLGDSSKLYKRGKGKIKVLQKDGKLEYTPKFYYIRNMKRNILTTGQSLEKGHQYAWRIYYKFGNGRHIATVKMVKNGMCPFHHNTQLWKNLYVSGSLVS